MKRKVSKIVLFAIFCSIFADTFSASSVSRALDLARNIQDPGAAGQQPTYQPGSKIAIPNDSVIYNMQNTVLKELNINIDTTYLTFVSVPTSNQAFDAVPLISNLSFIPKGTTEFTIIIKAYDSSGKPLETLKDLRKAINNYNFEELYQVVIADKNGNQIGSELEVPVEMAMKLTNSLYSGSFASSLGVNSQAVSGITFSYPISLRLQNIKNWQPGPASGQSLIGKNLSEFKQILGMSTTIQPIVISGSKPNSDNSMPMFNINIPTVNSSIGNKLRYAFVSNPWPSRTGGVQTVSNQSISQNAWNQIARLLKSGGYMSLIAFDKYYNYIAEPWNNKPAQYSLFMFDSNGNPVGLVNYKGQAIEPITFKSGMYSGSYEQEGIFSFSQPTSATPIEFGGLNSGSTTIITTYPFILDFWNNK